MQLSLWKKCEILRKKLVPLNCYISNIIRWNPDDCCHMYITMHNTWILCQFNYKITCIIGKTLFRYYNIYALHIHAFQLLYIIHNAGKTLCVCVCVCACIHMHTCVCVCIVWSELQLIIIFIYFSIVSIIVNINQG